MWKKIALISICLVIGFVIGCILTMAYTGHTMATTMFMLQEKEIVKMGEAARQACLNEPNEVAVWALENYISTLKRLKEERSSTEVENPYFIISPDRSLMFSYAELGQVYKRMGEVEKSQYNFEQAISHGKRLKEDAKLIIKLFDALDKSRNRNNDSK